MTACSSSSGAREQRNAFQTKTFRSCIVQFPVARLSFRSPDFLETFRKSTEFFKLATFKTIIMQVISILSICTLALASVVSANHGQFAHASAAPAYTEALPSKPSPGNPEHHWAARDAARYKYTYAATHENMKPTSAAHHWARDENPTAHPHFEVEVESDKKPTAVHHWASRWFKSTPKPAAAAVPEMTPVAGKPGHHFVRDAAARLTRNPYAGTRMSPSLARDTVRSILTGGTGIAKTCDRCVAAMQVGQALAQQSSADDFSSAVVGLCKQVKYKSNSACASSFGPSQVVPYMSMLDSADIGSQGKVFCKQFFGTC